MKYYITGIAYQFILLTNYCCSSFSRIGLSYTGINVANNKLFAGFPSQVEVLDYGLLTEEKDVNKVLNVINKLATSKFPLKDEDKITLIAAIRPHISLLSLENLSYCIWSLGALKCKVTHFSDDSLQELVRYTSNCIMNLNKAELNRILFGFGNFGIKWNNLSNTTQTEIIRVGLDEDVIDSHMVTTLVYSLGQMGANITQLPSNFRTVINRSLITCISSGDMKPLDIINSLQGLGKLQIKWKEFPVELTHLIMSEFSSMTLEKELLMLLLQSLVLLEVEWHNMTTPAMESIYESIKNIHITKTMKSKDIANILFSLGKLHLNWGSAPMEVRNVLLESLGNLIGTMQSFDVESVFTGFGLMQIRFQTFPETLQKAVHNRVKLLLPTMNIFCIQNVLWGYARMDVTVKMLGVPLATQLYQRTLDILHTFLPYHFGDLMWSLGTLGYTTNYLSRYANINSGSTSNNSSSSSSSSSNSNGDSGGDGTGMDPTGNVRLLAVLSRVYGGLPTRGAAFILWGLAKMGFTWRDLKVGGASLPQGRNVIPLKDSVFKYLEKRTMNLKEQDYAVILYSLGQLGALWTDVPTAVRDKLQKRLVKVSNFMTPRGVSNAVFGLGRMSAIWSELSEEYRGEWQKILASPKGFQKMSALELNLAIQGLGLMNAQWSELGSDVKRELLTALSMKSSEMSAEMMCNAICALMRKINCPINSFPTPFLCRSLSLLDTFPIPVSSNNNTIITSNDISEDSTNSATEDQHFRYLIGMEAIDTIINEILNRGLEFKDFRRTEKAGLIAGAKLVLKWMEKNSDDSFRQIKSTLFSNFFGSSSWIV